jgi:hypothetical protein
MLWLGVPHLSSECTNLLRAVSHRSALVLLGLASPSPAVARGEERGRTYLALGDSVAFGVTNIDGRADTLRNVAFSPDEMMLAASGNDGDIRLWVLADLFEAEIPRGPRAAH